MHGVTLVTLWEERWSQSRLQIVSILCCGRPVLLLELLPLLVGSLYTFVLVTSSSAPVFRRAMPAHSMTEPELSEGPFRLLSRSGEFREGVQRRGAPILHRMFGDLRFAAVFNFLGSLF